MCHSSLLSSCCLLPPFIVLLFQRFWLSPVCFLLPGLMVFCPWLPGTPLKFCTDQQQPFSLTKAEAAIHLCSEPASSTMFPGRPGWAAFWTERKAGRIVQDRIYKYFIVFSFLKVQPSVKHTKHVELNLVMHYVLCKQRLDFLIKICFE